MTIRALCCLLLWLASALLLSAQPGIVAEGGQPSDQGKLGSLEVQGEGFASLDVYIGSVALEGEGELLISARAKPKFAGEPGTPEKISAEDAAAFLHLPPPKVRANDPKAAQKARKNAYLLYRGFKGKVTLNDNRFVLAFQGKITALSLLGVAVGKLLGTGTYTLVPKRDADTVEGAWTAVPDTPNPLPAARIPSIAVGEQGKRPKAGR